MSEEKDFGGEYTLRQSMDLLLIGRKRLIKWSKMGILPHRREGFEWFFSWEDLVHFAFHRCLDCGEPKKLIDEEIFFCFSCGGIFSPNPDKPLNLDLFGSISQQRLVLFFQKIPEDTSDEETISLLQKHFAFSSAQAHRSWLDFVHQKEGLVQIGLAEGVYEQAKEDIPGFV